MKKINTINTTAKTRTGTEFPVSIRVNAAKHTWVEIDGHPCELSWDMDSRSISNPPL